MSDQAAKQNTDREIWRAKEGDFYSPSIHVTEGGGIGINVGGYVIVMPVEKWHALGKTLPMVTLPKLPKALRHGIDCEKVAHTRTGYLHDERDDTPYDVDGCSYCGRCHCAL